MKKRVLALTLSAVMTLSSTAAFAADANCTKVTNYNYSNLSNKYTSYLNCSNIKYKVTVNGKNVDLNSVDWKALINKKSKTTSVETKTPVVKETEVKETKTPVVEQPEIKEPEVKTPVVEQTEVKKPEEKTVENNNTSVSAYEQKVVELVNVERQKAGLPALTLDASISNVARIKSKDMADNNYFAHQSPTYGSAGDMLSQFGIRWSAWGENIAAGQKTPEIVVNAWMNSSGHRANILSSKFSKIGVGYVTDSNGRPYWTQIFTN